MEYRINKIDTDVRQKINQERSEDKVHNKKGIAVNKDKNDDSKDTAKEQEKLLKHDKDYKEKEEEKNEVIEDGKGHFIDIRR